GGPRLGPDTPAARRPAWSARAVPAATWPAVRALKETWPTPPTAEPVPPRMYSTSSSPPFVRGPVGPSKWSTCCSNSSQPRSVPKRGISPGCKAHRMDDAQYLCQPAESGYHRAPHSSRVTNPRVVAASYRGQTQRRELDVEAVWTDRDRGCVGLARDRRIRRRATCEGRDEGG